MERYARIAFVFAACFALIMALVPHPPPIPGHPSDKIMHMIAFAVLGMLAAYGFHTQSGIRLFVWLTAFGAMIEALQAIPMLHRDSDIRDLLADMAAVIFALSVMRYFFSRKLPGADEK